MYTNKTYSTLRPRTDPRLSPPSPCSFPAEACAGVDWGLCSRSRTSLVPTRSWHRGCSTINRKMVLALEPRAVRLHPPIWCHHCTPLPSLVPQVLRGGERCGLRTVACQPLVDHSTLPLLQEEVEQPFENVEAAKLSFVSSPPRPRRSFHLASIEQWARPYSLNLTCRF